MKTKTNNFSFLLDKISFCQFFLISSTGLIYLYLKDCSILTGILISALTSFAYTQLIKLSYNYKPLALFGFPIRLILIAPPCAILVHKLHSNLIALFIGFVLSQIIYFIFIWSFVKEENI